MNSSRLNRYTRYQMLVFIVYMRFTLYSWTHPDRTDRKERQINGILVIKG